MACIIKRIPREPQKGQMVVRINKDVYDQIWDICDETNQSVAKVTSQLLQYALKDYVIED